VEVPLNSHFIRSYTVIESRLSLQRLSHSLARFASLASHEWSGQSAAPQSLAISLSQPRLPQVARPRRS
jgi:hypothetical protein